MQPGTVSLVLASTATHAYWNFLVKRSRGGSTFIGLSKLAEVVLFAPAFAWWVMAGTGSLHGGSLLVLGGAALALANYAALVRAYETGDLSIVYPVARGGTLLFLPLLGYLVFGERISPLGWLAIACVLVGILVIGLPRFDRVAVATFARVLRSPAIGFALLAALATAGYTVWDKRAVQVLPAFSYFYAYTVVVAAVYAVLLWRSHTATSISAEWRAHRWPIVQVGALNVLSYLLVLVALRDGTSSYVLALRQLSIAVGVLLGWKLLGEELALPKRVGVVLLVLGCGLVALAG